MSNKLKKIITFVCLVVSISIMSGALTVSAATIVDLNTTTSYLVKGGTTTLSITGTSKKVTWSTTDKSVATVTNAGKVKAIDYGVAYIKATVNSKAYKCKVTVVDPSEIYFDPKGDTVIVDGNALSLKPSSYEYSATAVKKMGITYKVFGNSGVTVSSAGKVTATKAGSFTITAYFGTKKISTITMKAVEFTGMAEEKVSLDLYEEKKVEFVEGFSPAYSDVKVSSSNKSVAKVTKSSLVTMESDVDQCDGIYVEGLDDGTATITITVSGVTKTLTAVVGAGVTKLSPVEAVKAANYAGYTGNEVTTLTWVRNFIDNNKLDSDSLSDREKVTIIQNYFNSTFRQDVYNTTYEDCIPVILFNGGSELGGDCEFYAETFCFLCDCINIDVYYCGGSSNSGDGKGFVGHAWNKAKVDGTWYYIDAYWNTCTNNKYFLSETLWSDHRLGEEGYYGDGYYDAYVEDLN